jgi:hypothetical protein
LDQRIGFQLDLLDEAALLRFGRHVDALSGEVELPTMIWTAQSAFLIATEPQRYAAMGAEFVDQTEPAKAVAKRNQPLRQKLDPHRRTVVCRQFLSQQRRQPVTPEKIAHRRAGAGPGDHFVLILPKHADLRLMVVLGNQT